MWIDFLDMQYVNNVVHSVLYSVILTFSLF